jgi:hypothetical protein
MKSAQGAQSQADQFPHDGSKSLAKMRPMPPTHIETSDVLPQFDLQCS